ncbi:MAG: DUF4403 family protein, partial [Kiritimatiellae bacterium]|nr:DUF4403 family protein [Kiritimatiellia bacterium]
IIPDERDSTSKLQVGVGMNLDTLEKAINQLLPRRYPLKIPEGRGTVTRSDVGIYRAGRDRLGLDGTVRFDGEIDGPAWTKVRSGRASYKGTTLKLKISDDWRLYMAPDVKAEILEIAVSGAPDGISKWASNRYLVPGLTKQAKQFPMPEIKPAVEEAWRFSRFEWRVSREPSVILGFRPVRVRLGGPVIAETSNEIQFNLGLELRSSCSMMPATADWRNLDAGPLPALGNLSLEQVPSSFRVPLVADMESLAAVFKPQTVRFPGGSMEIHSLELSEFEGVLHARLNAAIDAPSIFGSLLPQKTKASLVMRAKPSCDPATGEIRLGGLSFNSRSNSYLVKRLSEGGTRTLETTIAALVPVYTGYLCNRARAEINLKSENLLNSQIGALANASPDFKGYIKTLKPRIKNIDVKPERIVLENGHLMLVMGATADLSLSIQ